MWREKKRWLPLVIGLMLFAFALYRFDAIIALVRTFLAIVSPFIIGTFLALLINLPMRQIDRLLLLINSKPVFKPVRRAISLTLSLVIVVVVITLLLVVIIPEIVTAVERLISVIPQLLKDFEAWLNERNTNLRAAFGLVETNEGEVRDLFQQIYQFFIGGLSYSSGMVLSAAQYLINLIVGLVFAIYLLFSKERIKDHTARFLHAVMPGKAGHTSTKILGMLTQSYTNFIAGQLLQALISSVLTALVLLIFGFPYPVLIGLITFVAAFIPVFGPFISGLLGMLLVLTVDPAQTPWFLLAFFIVQQVAGSVIYPRIMSDAIHIPSIWVLVAVTVGGGIMGIPGMLLFIPLTAVVYRLLADYILQKESKDKLKENTIDSV
ncbi:MAG: AI-2E family transporter [Clostridiales bacterium]|nr:AI-2E family transporter [Clostridiales bacterium]